MPFPDGFKQRLQGSEMLVAAGAHDALAARIFAQAGFDAIYMTGNGLSAALLGAPDIGLLTQTEMAQRAAAICAAVNIPVLADADTGYGNANNVVRTVREYEAGGVAIIQLEDQVMPKKCGAMQGLALISAEEHVEKLHAARQARTYPERLLIAARTDARKVSGFDEALARGKAYARAGADLVFLEMLQSEDEIRKAARSIDAPLMFNVIHGATPPLTPAQLKNAGVKLLSYPVASTLMYAAAVKKMAAPLLAHGQSADDLPLMPLHDYEQLLGLPDYY